MSAPPQLPPPPAAAPLADLLESATFAPPAPPPPPPSPSTILSAWSHLRSSSSSSPSTLAALETLSLHRRSLRLSSAHLALLPLHPRLVSPLLATAPHLLHASSLPFASLPLAPRLLLLGALASAKSSRNVTSNASSGSPTTKNLGSGQPGSDRDGDDPVVAVSRVLEDMGQGSESCDDLDHLALTGIGCALACSDQLHFGRILGSLIRICGRIGNLGVGVRVVKLAEWLVLGFVESRRMQKVQVLFEVTSPEKCEGEGYVLFPVVMAACGALRGLRVASVRHWLDFDPRLNEAPELTIQS